MEQSKEGSVHHSVEPEEQLLETDLLIDRKPEKQAEERTRSVETVHSENRFVQAGRYQRVGQVIEAEQTEQVDSFAMTEQSQLTSDSETECYSLVDSGCD